MKSTRSEESVLDKLFLQLIGRTLEILERELSPQLLYHDVAHTRDDVLPRVEYLAQQYGVSAREQFALKLAALFHDAGYLFCYQNNESLGAQKAENELAQIGVPSDTIILVKQLIMATAIPHYPRTLLEQIICDADLDSLGRKDFFYSSMCLRRELANYGTEIPVKQWLLRQKDFLETHSFFTGISRKERGPGKEKNISLLSELISQGY